MIRKCGACPKPIEIDKEHTSNIVYYKGKYYHSSCFCNIATKRSQSKIKTASEWENALDNLWEIEADTKKMLESALAKDDLNEWLLANYDIAAVPTRFWQMVADLERGIYKGKKCRPISINMLTDMWKWGQKHLNKIDAKNKTNHNGPQNDVDRLRYDLSILISHVGDYIKYTTTTKEESAEIKSRVHATNKINYEKLYTQSKEKQNDDNILDLMNDIF